MLAAGLAWAKDHVGGSRSRAVRLATALTQVRFEILRIVAANGAQEVSLADDLGLHCIRPSCLPPSALFPLVERLLRSSFAKQFSTPVEADLARFVVAWLERTRTQGMLTGTALSCAAAKLAQDCDSRIVLSVGPGNAKLSLLPPDSVLLDRPALHRVKAKQLGKGQSDALEERRNAAILMIACPLAPIRRDSQHAVHVVTDEDLVNAVSYNSARVEQVLEHIFARLPNLALIVSTELLHDPCLDIASRHGALAVQLVPASQMADLSSLVGQLPAFSLAELCASPDQYCCFAQRVREVKLGDKALVMSLEGVRKGHALATANAASSNRGLGPTLGQALFRGPSHGTLSQYKQAVARGLRLVTLWAEDVAARHGEIVHAGCSTELALWRWAERRADNARHSLASHERARAPAYNLLAEALLAPPFALLANSSEGCDPRMHMAHYLRTIRVASTPHVQLRSGPTGRATIVNATGPPVSDDVGVETLALKLEQLVSFMEVIAQILRIDQVSTLQHRFAPRK